MKHLHQIFLALDYKYDIEISDYFLQSEEFKNALTEDLYHFIDTELSNDHRKIKGYWNSIKLQLKDAIRSEEYERAEILNRLKKRLSKDWETFMILT